MLLFSTTLKINDHMTSDRFIRLLIEWNRGLSYKENVIPDIEWNGERTIRFGNDNLWLDIKEYRAANIIAARFEKRDTLGAVWDTDYIMNFDDMVMAIRLDRSYEVSALGRDRQFSPPYFISLLVDKGYLEDDGNLPVLRDPIPVDEDRQNDLAKIRNQPLTYRLPVIYVSQTRLREDPVDTHALARKLKGMAHVLVEMPDIENERSEKSGDETSEHAGAIDIYFPSMAESHQRHLYQQESGHDEALMNRVIHSVVTYSNTKTVDPLYTWQGVNTALLFEQIDEQKAKREEAEMARREAEESLNEHLKSLPEKEREITERALAKASKLIEAFDSEIDRYHSQIAALTNDNSRLLQENHGLKAKLDSLDLVPVLCRGEEPEFYEGEVRDIVLSLLSEGLKSVYKDARRAHLIRDLIRHNDYSEMSEHKSRTLKQLLKGYTRMDSRIHKGLEDLGFEVSAEGRHYKLTYFGDRRYTFSLPKSGSDSQRAGKNNAQEMINYCF